jgi:hypothetical protein
LKKYGILTRKRYDVRRKKYKNKRVIYINEIYKIFFRTDVLGDNTGGPYLDTKGRCGIYGSEACPAAGIVVVWV